MTRVEAPWRKTSETPVPCRTGEKSDERLNTHGLLRGVSAASTACLPANRIGQLQAAIAAGTYRVSTGLIAEGLLRYTSPAKSCTICNRLPLLSPTRNCLELA
ncbi:MAG: flagellar biosynthesis anti-sigma factor FlgM [Janthinobacterium lividum]